MWGFKNYYFFLFYICFAILFLIKNTKNIYCILSIHLFIKLLLINGFEIMLNKTIRVSEEVHDSLSALATKNNTFNDVIKKLIDNYEEFSDEQADFYNQEIERIDRLI